MPIGRLRLVADAQGLCKWGSRACATRRARIELDTRYRKTRAHLRTAALGDLLAALRVPQHPAPCRMAYGFSGDIVYTLYT